MGSSPKSSSMSRETKGRRPDVWAVSTLGLGQRLERWIEQGLERQAEELASILKAKGTYSWLLSSLRCDESSGSDHRGQAEPPSGKL